MAETNEKVMAMVRDELAKNPKIPTEELFRKAQKIDAAIKNLSLRQFHARYPLQVKRRKSAGAGKGKRRRARRPAKPAPRKDLNRPAIRDALLAFARDLSTAESKGTAAVIDVLSGVDKYVDRIARAIG